MVREGGRGVTAGPATFGKAITEGPECRQEIAQLVAEGRKPSELYEVGKGELTGIGHIRGAACRSDRNQDRCTPLALPINPLLRSRHPDDR